MTKGKRNINPSTKYQGRGLALYNAIATSIHTNEAVAKKAGYVVNTLYGHFKQPDLADAIMVRYGKAIPYDFSIQFPELALYFNDTPSFKEHAGDYKLALKLESIQNKYTELLEKHNLLLEENNRLKEELIELRTRLKRK